MNKINLIRDNHTLKDFCDKGIVLKNGKIVYQGVVEKAIKYYEESY